MAMAMMMMTANAAPKVHNTPAPAPKPAHGMVVRHDAPDHGHVHHTNFCLHEMHSRKHSKRCQCDCHYPAPKIVPNRGHHAVAPVPAHPTGAAIKGGRR